MPKVPILMPQLGDSIAEATVLRLLAAQGGDGGDHQRRAHRAGFVAATEAHGDRLGGVGDDLQTELDLPAPAVSVSGGKAYGLWFSFATAVPLARAAAFAEGLRQHYLAEVPTTRVTLHPHAPLKLVPAHQGDGRWSAYIDASLGSMFVDEPWLEMAPSPHKQAELLAGQASIKPDVLERALGILQPAATSAPAYAPTGETDGVHQEPVGFLLAIMNDAAVDTGLRIEAAKALLPYFRKALD